MSLTRCQALFLTTSLKTFNSLIFIPLLLTLFFLTSARGNATPSLTLTFIDVGEGDAIYLENSGHCNFLIDAGNPKSGANVFSTLVQMGVTRIDHLILTHPHLDHIGGVFTVAQFLPVSRFYDNGEDLSLYSKTHDMARWYQDLVRKSPRYSVLKTGHRFECPRSHSKFSGRPVPTSRKTGTPTPSSSWFLSAPFAASSWLTLT